MVSTLSLPQKPLWGYSNTEAGLQPQSCWFSESEWGLRRCISNFPGDAVHGPGSTFWEPLLSEMGGDSQGKKGFSEVHPLLEPGGNRWVQSCRNSVLGELSRKVSDQAPAPKALLPWDEGREQHLEHRLQAGTQQRRPHGSLKSHCHLRAECHVTISAMEPPEWYTGESEFRSLQH